MSFHVTIITKNTGSTSDIGVSVCFVGTTFFRANLFLLEIEWVANTVVISVVFVFTVAGVKIGWSFLPQGDGKHRIGTVDLFMY